MKAVRADVKDWVNFEGINAAALGASADQRRPALCRGSRHPQLAGDLEGDHWPHSPGQDPPGCMIATEGRGDHG